MLFCFASCYSLSYAPFMYSVSEFYAPPRAFCIGNSVSKSRCGCSRVLIPRRLAHAVRFCFADERSTIWRASTSFVQRCQIVSQSRSLYSRGAHSLLLQPWTRFLCASSLIYLPRLLAWACSTSLVRMLLCKARDQRQSRHERRRLTTRKHSRVPA